MQSCTGIALLSCERALLHSLEHGYNVFCILHASPVNLMNSEEKGPGCPKKRYLKLLSSPSIRDKTYWIAQSLNPHPPSRPCLCRNQFSTTESQQTTPMPKWKVSEKGTCPIKRCLKLLSSRSIHDKTYLIAPWLNRHPPSRSCLCRNQFSATQCQQTTPIPKGKVSEEGTWQGRALDHRQTGLHPHPRTSVEG